MKILVADDEALALEMLVDSIREVKLDAGAVNSYRNEYMSQYYWAEFI